MLNKKLIAIASLIEPKDIVIDIGCDHAYLPIYLKKEKLCKEVYASDISENVIKIAKENIMKKNTNIEVYLSDGFKGIQNNKINTAIISGMGTSTILNIINNAPKNIEKYIISSNNDYEVLRKEMLKKDFYIQKEMVVKERDKYYPIIVFTKNFQKESNLSLKYGKSNSKEYYKYLEEKEKSILKRIPKKRIIIRLKHLKRIKELKKLQM